MNFMLSLFILIMGIGLFLSFMTNTVLFVELTEWIFSKFNEDLKPSSTGPCHNWRWNPIIASIFIVCWSITLFSLIKYDYFLLCLFIIVNFLITIMRYIIDQKKQ